MKQNWQIKPFEDCIEHIKYTSKVQSKDYKSSGKYPIVSQEDELISGYWDREEDVFKVTKPLIIFGDHTRVLKYVDFNFVLGADGVKIIQPKDFINTKFFMYFLKSANIKNLGYARHYRLLKDLEIHLPPLAEQRRIVAILDAKFAKIDALKAAAQKNLDNAEQLWKAKLEKEFGNKEWKMMKLGEVAKKMLAGGDAPKDDYSETKTEQYNIPIYANAVADNGLYGYTNKAIVTEPSITIAARGSGTGTVFLRNDSYYPIVRLIVVIPNTKITLQKYVYYAVGNIKIAHSGSAIPQLTIPMIKQYEIPIPPLAEQTAIVSRLDALSAQISELKAKYRRQIECCDELRQSLLRAAFEGEM